ncbi:hypothetical protein RJ640_017617 [Escallonia rubra]|uniref:Uncharacterized protein n=1 Tax=Escallonia rubra TaxID=112253 RepID=A0AA88R129_9ASTE|nr:hypothetical protein RJ640_017617 [Escallonia rubra]
MPSSSGGRRCGSGGGFPAGGSSLRGAERRPEDFDHLSLENIAALRGGVSQSPSQYSLRKLPSTSSDHEMEASASTVDKEMAWQQNAKEHMHEDRPGKLSCRVHLKWFQELLETHGVDDTLTNVVRLTLEECVEDYGPDFDKVRWFEREKW